jgi:hypothetical protein
MPYKYTVQKGDTLNDISQKYGFKNYKEAGVESVPSGNFDLIRPGEEITIGNYEQPVQFDTSADYTTYEQNSKKFGDKYGTMGSSDFDRAQESPNGGDLTGSNGEGGAVSVVSEVDMGNGTKTVVYSDGTTQVIGGGGTQQTEEKDPIQAQYESGLNETTQKAKDKAAQVTNTLNTIRNNVSANTQALIDSINATFDASIKVMEDANKRLLAGKGVVEQRTGRSRYVNKISEGIITDEIQQGEMRIADLNAQRLSAIAKAEQYQNEMDIDLFNSEMDYLNDIEKNMNDEIANLLTGVQEQYKNMREEVKAQEEAESAARQLAMEQVSNALPAFASAYSGYSDDEKIAFVSEVAKQYGVDPNELHGMIVEAVQQSDMDELEKQEMLLDMENTISNIYTREKNADISAGRLALDREKYEFDPPEEEKSKVMQYANENLSPEDVAKVMEDQDYFYYILSLIE